MIKFNKKGWSDLHKLTVIIPTFNRPQHFLRLIKYYASQNTPMSFLILDSSCPEIVESNQRVSNLLGNQAKHIIFPSSMPATAKIIEGLELIDTPFSVFCADDDLIFIEGLAQALNYLKNNPDYVCVDGIYLNFRLINRDIQINIEYSGEGIDANHLGARVFKLFQRYESLFYGVYRTAQMRDVYADMSKIASLHYFELFQSVATLLLGKKHRLPIFYAARQACESAEPNREKWQTHSWFADNPSEVFEHYLPYREELWRFCEKHVQDLKLTQAEFNRSMDIAHAVFFSAGCSPHYFYSKLQSYWPDDAFQKTGPQNDVCRHLKKTYRQLWDVYGDRFLYIVQIGIKVIFSWHNLKRLDRKIKIATDTKWNCALDKKVRWLSKIDDFQKAYQELCIYLG